MERCRECIEFHENPLNPADGRCEMKESQVSGEGRYCSSFRKRLNKEEQYILNFLRKETVSAGEYSNFEGKKKEIFDKLVEKRCFSGKEIEKPLYYYRQDDVFKNEYPDIFDVYKIKH